MPNEIDQKCSKTMSCCNTAPKQAIVKKRTINRISFQIENEFYQIFITYFSVVASNFVFVLLK